MELINKADQLAGYLRDDRLHMAKYDTESKARKVLNGLSGSFILFDNTKDEALKELNINTTTQLINEWERMVGIPDQYIGIANTLEQRRKNVLLKIAGIKATTKQQFENLGDILGIPIQVFAGGDVIRFTYTFPILLITEEQLPYAIVININKQYSDGSGFPYTFPITFLTNAETILRSFFERLKPAHTKLYFRYV